MIRRKERISVENKVRFWDFPGGPVLGSILGQGTRSHMPQLRFIGATKDLCAATKTQHIEVRKRKKEGRKRDTKCKRPSMSC